MHVPAGVARAMGSAADVVARLLRWQEEWGLSRGAVEDAVGVRYGDGRRAREVLGYAPRVGLAEGVGRACEVSCSLLLSLFRVGGGGLMGGQRIIRGCWRRGRRRRRGKWGEWSVVGVWVLLARHVQTVLVMIPKWLDSW